MQSVDLALVEEEDREGGVVVEAVEVVEGGIAKEEVEGIVREEVEGVEEEVVGVEQVLQ